MVGQLVMLAQEGGGAEGCGDGSGDGQADQVIGAGGGIGLLGRFLLFGGADDDDGAGVIGGGRDDLAGGWDYFSLHFMFANCALLMHGTGCGGGCRGIDNPITGDMILYIKHFALTLTDMICTAVSNYCVRMGLLVCYSIALYTLMPVILIVYCIYCPFSGPNMLTSCASGFIVATVTANITYEIVIFFDYISTHTSANMLFIIIGIGSPCVRMAYLGTVTTAAADVRMRAIMIVSMTSHIVQLLCSCIISFADGTLMSMMIISCVVPCFIPNMLVGRAAAGFEGQCGDAEVLIGAVVCGIEFLQQVTGSAGAGVALIAGA